MDAVPVTLGQEFGGYRAQVELGASRVRAAAEATSELPLGGTAAGTGLNAAPGFARQVIERVAGRHGPAVPRGARTTSRRSRRRTPSSSCRARSRSWP